MGKGSQVADQIVVAPYIGDLQVGNQKQKKLWPNDSVLLLIDSAIVIFKFIAFLDLPTTSRMSKRKVLLYKPQSLSSC